MSFEKARIKQLIHREETRLQIVENKREKLIEAIKKLYELLEEEENE